MWVLFFLFMFVDTIIVLSTTLVLGCTSVRCSCCIEIELEVSVDLYWEKVLYMGIEVHHFLICSTKACRVEGFDRPLLRILQDKT